MCTVDKVEAHIIHSKRLNLEFYINSFNMFHTIDIDRDKLTIMGVQFSDLKTLENTANALGSNMFEGFEPTPKGIEIIRDYMIGRITLAELIKFAKDKLYA